MNKFICYFCGSAQTLIGFTCMSKTYEQIKYLSETDRLPYSMVPYVQPLLDKITELEEEIKHYRMQEFDMRSDRGL